MAARPSKLAQLWTPAGIARVPVEGAWPHEIAHEGWIYFAPRDQRGNVLAFAGRHSGVEIAAYRLRREIGCDDAAVIAQAQRDQEARGDGTNEPEPNPRSA